MGYVNTMNIESLSRFWNCFISYTAMLFFIFLKSAEVYRLFGINHCVKSVQTYNFFWSVFSCIRAEYGKIRTRKNSVFGHFPRSESSKVSR